MKPTLKSERFTLRPYKDSDVHMLHSHINTKIVAKNTTINLPWSEHYASWWISFILDAADQEPLSEIHFVIEVEGEYAGTIGIINIEGHKGEMGYWMVEKHMGKGYMTEAVGLVSDYALKKLGLVRIFAPVLPFNKASAKVLQNNGFEYEGRLRKFYEKKGNYIDALFYAKVKE